MSDDEDDKNLPELPYPDDRAGSSSGWSGSDTSRERAERADTEGITADSQRMVLHTARRVGARGVTVVDMRNQTSLHHGVLSGALSVLHQKGRLARLTERRDRCLIYVLPEFVNGRETQAAGSNKRISAAEAWDHGFYTGIQFEADEGTELPPNPYR